jgi:hypothetical protein
MSSSGADPTKPPGIKRRTVAGAAAWSVPTIAVAAATPATAASGVPVIAISGLGCKLPGNSQSTYKGYAFLLTVTNSSNVPVVVNITNITLNGDGLGAIYAINLPTCTGSPNPFGLAANTAYPRVALLTQNAANSSNGTLSITYTIDGGVTFETVTAIVAAAPPVQGASCSAFSAEEKMCIADIVTIPAWQPNTAYNENDVVSVNGSYLSANNAGTSGAIQPTLPGVGNTVVDGSITWTQFT